MVPTVTTERLIVVLDRHEPGGVAPQDAERVLWAQPGVVRVYTNPALETVYVAYDPARADAARLVAALVRTGVRVAECRPG
jgi:hypothetical protein